MHNSLRFPSSSRYGIHYFSKLSSICSSHWHKGPLGDRTSGTKGRYPADFPTSISNTPGQCDGPLSRGQCILSSIGLSCQRRQRERPREHNGMPTGVKRCSNDGVQQALITFFIFYPYPPVKTHEKGFPANARKPFCGESSVYLRTRCCSLGAAPLTLRSMLLAGNFTPGACAAMR